MFANIQNKQEPEKEKKTYESAVRLTRVNKKTSQYVLDNMKICPW